MYAEIVSKLRPYVDLARPYNAVAAVLSFLLGFYFYDPKTTWREVVIGGVVVILLHSAFTMQNDLYDLPVDIANQRKTPLTTGEVQTGSLRQAIFNLVLASLFIAWFGAEKMVYLAFIAAYCTVMIAYNRPPLSGSKRPITSIALLGFLYAFLPLVFGFAISGNNLTTRFWQFAGLVTFIRMSISLLKDFKDSRGDRELGKRTFYLVYGKKVTTYISSLIALTGYPLLVLLVGARLRGPSLLAAAVLGMYAVFLIQKRLRLLKAGSEKQLSRLFRQCFVAEHYFAGIMLICFLLS